MLIFLRGAWMIGKNQHALMRLILRSLADFRREASQKIMATAAR
jgi:hypothetical protein